MTEYTYIKQVNLARLIDEVKAAGLTTVSHADSFGATLKIVFTSSLSNGQKTILDTIVANHILTTTREQIDAIIDSAIAFGDKIKRDFVAENIMLGITQRGLTKHVRVTLREVKDAIESGSLYDAILEIKSLNQNDFDDVILTPARLLVFRNKIETFLNVPLATSWNQEKTWS